MFDNFETDPTELTTSQITNLMIAIRDKRRELAALKKPLDDRYKTLEETLIVKLAQEEAIGIKTAFGSATLTEQDIPYIENQEVFNKFILTNNALYLLQDKLSQKACLELEYMGELPPGLRILKKRKIALHSI